MFSDKYYEKELSAPEYTIMNHAKATLDRKLYVQLLVQYSAAHSDQIEKIQDKLNYIRLTIRKCYLTRTQNEKTNVLQMLIEHGYLYINSHNFL